MTKKRSKGQKFYVKFRGSSRACSGSSDAEKESAGEPAGQDEVVLDKVGDPLEAALALQLQLAGDGSSLRSEIDVMLMVGDL